MAWLNELPGMGAAEDRAAKALSFPVGAASPLWLAFGAAAGAGVAWWWATRWTRPVNLEAFFATPKAASKPAPTAVVLELFPKPEPAPEPVVTPEITPAPVVELAPEPLVEMAPEPVAEPAPAPVLEVAPEPVPEPAPAPVVATAPKPKPVPAAPPEPLVPDDLTLIVGIGPKLAAALAERGVVQFAQLAKWTGKDLEKIDKALNLKGRAVRDAWVAQAKRFAGV